MNAKRKGRSDDDSLPQINPRWVKWGIGVITGMFGLFLAVLAVWDRVESHWRLESIQKSNDQKIAADFKAARDKSDADNKALARRAESGRAWLFWSVADAKAVNASQWAELCKFLKRPGDMCARYERDAEQYREEAAAAKRAAQDVGKEKP